LVDARVGDWREVRNDERESDETVASVPRTLMSVRSGGTVGKDALMMAGKMKRS
jgi:hypothetical protein